MLIQVYQKAEDHKYFSFGLKAANVRGDSFRYSETMKYVATRKLSIKLILQPWAKGCRQIYKIKQNRFFYGMFYSWCLAVFYRKTSKFAFWVASWILTIKFKHFRDFLEIS